MHPRRSRCVKPLVVIAMSVLDTILESIYIIMQKPSNYTDRSKGRKDGYCQIEYYQIEVWYAECLYMEGDATILCTMTNEPIYGLHVSKDDKGDTKKHLA